MYTLQLILTLVFIVIFDNICHFQICELDLEPEVLEI